MVLVGQISSAFWDVDFFIAEFVAFFFFFFSIHRRCQDLVERISERYFDSGESESSNIQYQIFDSSNHISL